jgi:hypothetical protein
MENPDVFIFFYQLTNLIDMTSSKLPHMWIILIFSPPVWQLTNVINIGI